MHSRQKHNAGPWMLDAALLFLDIVNCHVGLAGSWEPEGMESVNNEQT